MAIVAPILFIIAAIAAVTTIWRSVRIAVPAMRSLHRQVAECTGERSITHCVMDMRSESQQDAPDRSIRRRGRRQPKPVTHRLHHFAKAAHAA